MSRQLHHRAGKIAAPRALVTTETILKRKSRDQRGELSVHPIATQRLLWIAFDKQGGHGFLGACKDAQPDRYPLAGG